MLWLLHQPGERLYYTCYAIQERINLSLVPTAPCVFFQSLSSSLAYPGSSKQCVQHEQQGSCCHKQDEQERVRAQPGSGPCRWQNGPGAASCSIEAGSPPLMGILSPQLQPSLGSLPMTPAGPLPQPLGCTLTDTQHLMKAICSMRISSGTTRVLVMLSSNVEQLKDTSC